MKTVNMIMEDGTEYEHVECDILYSGNWLIVVPDGATSSADALAYYHSSKVKRATIDWE